MLLVVFRGVIDCGFIVKAITSTATRKKAPLIKKGIRSPNRAPINPPNAGLIILDRRLVPPNALRARPRFSLVVDEAAKLNRAILKKVLPMPMRNWQRMICGGEFARNIAIVVTPISVAPNNIDFLTPIRGIRIPAGSSRTIFPIVDIESINPIVEKSTSKLAMKIGVTAPNSPAAKKVKKEGK